MLILIKIVVNQPNRELMAWRHRNYEGGERREVLLE